MSMVPLRLSLLLPCLWALEIPFRVYVRTLASPLLATAVMAVAVVAARLVMVEAGLLERAVTGVVVGGVSYLGALMVLDRRLIAEVHTLARDVLSRSKA